MYTNEIKAIASEVIREAISIRRELHRHPELGFKEFNTASLIAQTLSKLGLEVRTNIAETGVAGLLKGRSPGKTIAIRSDMDALPVTEQTYLEYSSLNEGVMHACGHDAHISIVLGCAMILSRLKDKLPGNVKFIFQPGEEGLGGARHMIDEGVLNNPGVDAIIAAHVMPSLDSGYVSVGSGPVMASPSEFDITIIGKGGHAAEPHKAIDPIIAGANLVNMLQAIVTREKDPVRNAVISVTSFLAGNTYNVIPDTARLKGTVRTFDKSMDKFISERMERITASIAKAMGAEYSFRYKVGYPPVVNDENISRLVYHSAKKIVGEGFAANNAQPSMLAEDFAYYAQEVPGAIFNLGCKAPGSDIVHNLHSSKLCIDESCISVGMQVMAQCAVNYLANIELTCTTD